MGNFKPVGAWSSTLDNVPHVQGQVIFLEDNYEIWWDPTDSKRVPMRETIILDTEAERLATLAPLSKFYYVVESNVLYRFGSDGEWHVVADMLGVQEHIDDTSLHVSADMVRVRSELSEDTELLPRDADTLGGKSADEFMLANEKGAANGVATLDANGKVPESQLQKPVATLITLTAAGWDATSKTQTAAVAGVLADESSQLIQPVPAVASQGAFFAAGILCTGQSAGSLTFTAQTVPTEDINVYVVLQEVQG